MATLTEQAGNEREVVEPQTKIPFPKKMSNRKILATVGMGMEIYAFGLNADVTLVAVFKHKNMPTSLATTTAGKPSIPRELYETVIDTDAGMTLRMISTVRTTMWDFWQRFNEGLGRAMEELWGHKDEELLNEVMGELNENMELQRGSTIEITRLPGYTLQTKGRIVSKVQSEFLCRAYFYLHLGDDPLDEEAKQRFGEHLLPLIE